MTERPPGLDKLLDYVAAEISKCKHTDTWFDRAICPDPCNAMHDRCVDCGWPVDTCALLPKDK